jgi:hypothetical protein
MILPGNNSTTDIHLLRIPNDYEGHESFRHVTGLIAEVESNNPKCDWGEILAHLETQGYEEVKFVLGPSLK